MVGGIDKKSHFWDSKEIVKKIQNLIEKDKNKIWTISSSQRTPKDCIKLLEKLAKSSKNIKFFKAEDTKKGWLEEEYNKNFVVWITSDSMSMIYEAISAGCKVGIIPVNFKNKNSKFIMSLNYLLEKKLVVDYNTWLKTNKMNDAPKLNEAKRSAEEILNKWFINAKR